MICKRLLWLVVILSLVGLVQAEVKLDRGIVLDRQFQQVPPESWNTVVPEDVQLIKRMGFDFAKVLINPAPMISGNTINTANMWYVDELVNVFLGQGIPVVVTIHPEPAFKTTYLGSSGGFTDMLGFYEDFAGYLAQRWEPNELVFQLMTEPFGNYQDWNLMLPQMVQAVRTTMPDHTLILSGDQSGTIAGLVHIDPGLINDSNVVYGFTYWNEANLLPFLFQGGGFGSYYPYLHDVPYPSSTSNNAADYVTQAGNPDYTGALAAVSAYCNTPWDMNQQRAALQPINTWNQANGGNLKVFCYEFGTPLDPGQGGGVVPADRVQYIHDKRVALEANNIGWAYWSYNETFTCLDYTIPRIAFSKEPSAGWIDGEVMSALGVPYCAANPTADLDQDCSVDMSDYSILANHWSDDSTSSVPPSSRIKSNKITVIASSYAAPYSPALTIDGSGLFIGPYPTVDYDPTGNYHDPMDTTAWLSSYRGVIDSAVADKTAIGQEWLLYTFDGVYALGEMLVWNYNFYGRPDRGIKEVYVEYSADGVNWTRLMDGVNDYWTFAQADGGWSYLFNATVNFGGAAAKFVAITPKMGSAGQWGADDGYYGLSELRFYGTKQSISITATASSSIAPYDAGRTVDGSGLFVGPYPTVDYNPSGNYHDPIDTTAWLSNWRGVIDSAGQGTAAGREWLRYAFDGVYALDEMLVWNYNFYGRPDRGLKEVYVEYSADGVNWTRLMDDANDYWTFAQADGGWSYLYNTTVNFGGAAAKFVAITPKMGGAGQWGAGDDYYGLSEVRFSGTKLYEYVIIEPNTITATACSFIEGYDPNYAVNGAGLYANYAPPPYDIYGDFHAPEVYHKAWLSHYRIGSMSSAAANTTMGEAWFKVQFDGVYSLNEMLVWNYNFGPNDGQRGIKKVYIEYSDDGINWTKLMNDANDYWIFSRAPAGGPGGYGVWNYSYNTVVNFNGARAKYVAITAPAGGEGQWVNDGYYGLSELRFYGNPSLPCPIGDLSNNCKVDFFDIEIFASHWLEEGFQ